MVKLPKLTNPSNPLNLDTADISHSSGTPQLNTPAHYSSSLSSAAAAVASATASRSSSSSASMHDGVFGVARSAVHQHGRHHNHPMMYDASNPTSIDVDDISDVLGSSGSLTTMGSEPDCDFGKLLDDIFPEESSPAYSCVSFYS